MRSSSVTLLPMASCRGGFAGSSYRVDDKGHDVANNREGALSWLAGGW